MSTRASVTASTQVLVEWHSSNVTARYTVLRVADACVPLFEEHVQRLGETSRAPLRHFASQAPGGVYRVTWDAMQLETTPRSDSRLKDGSPARFVVSPFADRRGRFAKPAPPSPYDSVRVEGLSSLLTDPLGEEIYEACLAGIVAWDGATLVLPPEEVPAVASTAEARIAAVLAPRRARILVAGDWPILLINAVVGTCEVKIPGRGSFPATVRARLEVLLQAPFHSR